MDLYSKKKRKELILITKEKRLIITSPETVVTRPEGPNGIHKSVTPPLGFTFDSSKEATPNNCSERAIGALLKRLT
jgi:hypothetical protein